MSGKPKRQPKMISIRRSGFILLVFAVFVLGLLLWSAKFKRDPKLRVGDPGELSVLLPSIVGLTQGTLEQGNRIEVLQNGDGFFPRMLQDIAAAKQSVHVEMFIWWDGKLARQLAAALAAKARQGVTVRLLVDGSGGRQLNGPLSEMLADAGAHVAWFHPIRVSNLARYNNRDHRKIIVVDGRIGYVGGHGIGDEWLGNGQDKKHWRDTGLRIEGPTVARLQSAFAENWIEETGEVFADDRYFPRLSPAGTTPAHVAFTSPSGSVASVQILYYLAIAAARREVLIQNPYLLPEDEAIDALAAAVKRGVDVRIMVPSATATDNAIVQHASHHRYGALLKAGVKVYEYERTLLHSKVMVVDGIWSSIGSTNFDARSFELNDEINVGIIDRAIAAQLRATFAADMKYARQRTSGEWEDRGMWHRLKDMTAYLAHEQL